MLPDHYFYSNKVKLPGIAVCSMPHHYENKCHIGSHRGDIPAFTPSEITLVLNLVTLEGLSCPSISCTSHPSTQRAHAGPEICLNIHQ